MSVDPDSDTSLEELLTKADEAMYQNKKRKRRLLSEDQDSDQSALPAEHTNVPRLQKAS